MLLKMMKGYYTFSKKALAVLVENKMDRLTEKAVEFDAEVFSDEYKNVSSYRPGEPWASIHEAVDMAKQELTEKKGVAR